MKRYPSIARSTGTSFRGFKAYVFDKLDGTNIRIEWQRRRGWCKFGTRTRLVDTSDEKFGIVIPLFNHSIAEPLEKIFVDNKWQKAVVFAEFHGPNSIAGLHTTEDPKKLTVFDVAVDNKGIITPSEFLKRIASKVETPGYLGLVNWTRGYVKKVRLGEVEGVTFEGVVGKSNKRLGATRAKAKTQAWIDAVMELKGEEEGRKIVNS